MRTENSACQNNRAYFDKGIEESNNENSNDPGLSKGVAINLKGDDNKATSYLVTEDMSGVFLYMIRHDYANVGNSIEFDVLPSDPEVSCQRILQISGAYNGAVKSNVYYVPELRKGTQIKFSATYAKLFRANNSEAKGVSVNLKGDDNKQTAYLVQEDLHDVFMICKANTNPPLPAFNTLPGVPIVATKKLHNATVNGPGGSYTHDDIYYIPELRAGTSITNFGGSCHMFY